MKSWFASRKEARKELKRRQDRGNGSCQYVWKWTHTKRQKPFFVGSRFQWLNI